MSLVAYDSSDESDAVSTENLVPLPVPNTRKPGAEKLLQKSADGKFLVAFDTHALASPEISEPSHKKIKLGVGVKDFNSFLPAPKRTTSGPGAASRSRVINLKTNAEPSFNRQSDDSLVVKDDSYPPSSLTSESISQTEAVPNAREVVIEKKSIIFRPLSVSRKPLKKKASSLAESLKSVASSKQSIDSSPTPPTSLFGVPIKSAPEEGLDPVSSSSYEPVMYQSNETLLETPSGVGIDAGLELTNDPNTSTSGQNALSLQDIATSLNLSASQRRQLLGRNGAKGISNNDAYSAVKITNFNTDAEYAANEAARQAGEAVKHQPVRAISSGKHSLKQLITSAVGQKDALDEKFAEGRRNKKEVSGRYGW